MKCRHCGAGLELPLVDLGSAPPSNRYLTEATLKVPEQWFPLRVLVCESCWLVQTEDFARVEELFDADYAYFSSVSESWLAHCQRYVAEVTERFGLDSGSHVIEVAANDGALLQYVRERGIPCTGIEPTASTAAAARAKGIHVVEAFFGESLARRLVEQGQAADLIAANNVLAHVPDINDFVRGFAVVLNPGGVVTCEFPHLVELIDANQFDTIYHEHFSYLSFTATERILRENGLAVFDVQQLVTHGGSLRVFSQRADTGPHPRDARVDDLLRQEAELGITTAAYYAGFQARADGVKNGLLDFLLQARRRGDSVAAYGAAAKGNTLLNYAGVRPDLLPFVADRSSFKQGRYLPGSRIPIVDEDRIRIEKPDYVLILPWNLQEELTRQLDYIRTWGGRFASAVPNLSIR